MRRDLVALRLGRLLDRRDRDLRCRSREGAARQAHRSGSRGRTVSPRTIRGSSDDQLADRSFAPGDEEPRVRCAAPRHNRARRPVRPALRLSRRPGVMRGRRCPSGASGSRRSPAQAGAGDTWATMKKPTRPGTASSQSSNRRDRKRDRRGPGRGLLRHSGAEQEAIEANRPDCTSGRKYELNDTLS